MNSYSRILAALLLLGASGNMVACGDDDKDNNGDGEEDAGKDSGGDEPDAGGDEPDSGGDEPDGDTPDGGDEKPPVEDDKCPDHPNVKEQGSVCVITGSTGNEIKSDLKLTNVKGKQGYLISKGVFVGEDVGGGASPDASKKTATLTIDKGVTLFGEDSLSFLLISRGSKIEAEGTAKYPIVFTSGASGAPKPGRWGGVIINGRAPSNRAVNGDVSGEAGTGKYSGPDAADNSGTVKYVRIEFSGGKIDSMNELNGLALQGVGNKTTIEYVHVHATDDDGIEFFGGTVNAKHIIITAFADDGIDWTDGWTGNLQFAIAQQWSYSNPGTGNNDGANGIEADNNDAKVDATPYSEPTLSNITLVGASDITVPVGGNGMNLRRGTKGHIHSSVILDFKTSCITLRGADSAGFVNNGLDLVTSRMFCNTDYQPKPAAAMPGASADIDPAAAQKLFDDGDSNEKLADKNAALEDPYAQSTSVDFTPKASSGLLEGGKTPSGSFFEKVEFIGALGDKDNWTEGDWFKITPFTP